MKVSDRLKMRCLQELAHVKYVPKLNLMTTEETHKDYERLKRNKKPKVEDFNAYYLNIVEEMSKFYY